MINAGIMLPQIDMSQSSINFIRAANKLTFDNPLLDIIVFYESWGRQPMPMQFGMLMEREIWGHRGTVIATNLRTAHRLIGCPGPKKKYFYVWELEWLSDINPDYIKLRDVYNNDRIELIARTPSHAKLIENIWKKPAFIMDDWDHNVLKEILV